MEDNKIIFEKYISDCINDIQAIQSEWRRNFTEMVFKKNSEKGFDVILGYDKNYLYLDTDRGFHEHFEAYRDFSCVLEHVIRRVRDLLTKNMRIREVYTNDKPRKWILEHFENDIWKIEAVHGRILWNYFGKKTEKTYSNDIIPTTGK